MDNAMTRRAPTHLWIVGILSLLWNGFGCYDYLMSRTRNTDYLKSMMPDADPAVILGYIDGMPIWAQIGWGLGVWLGLATIFYGRFFEGAQLGWHPAEELRTLD